MMSSLVYLSALYDGMTDGIDFASDAFKAMLVTDAYIPDQDAHTKRSDVTDEAIGSGYTAGGVAAAVSISKNTLTNRVEISLGAVSWPGATIAAAGAVYYKDRGGLPSADELVAYIDFVSNISSTNGTFSLTGSTLRIQN